jgi:hypothetical protein
MNGQGPSTIAALLRHSGTDLVARYAHLSPTHLHGALEGVSGFGKEKPWAAQKGIERTDAKENSSLKVTGTGMDGDEEKQKTTQVVRLIGRGERI